jgi:hypothetical protein
MARNEQIGAEFMNVRAIFGALSGAVFGLGMTLMIAAPAIAGCGSEVELGQASANCVRSGTQTNDYISHHTDHVYSIRAACEIGGTALCAEPAVCTIDGHDGRLFDVLEDGVVLGWQACLTDQEAEHLGGITPGAVARAFQRLSWPSSPMVIQPPNGRTLVNFDTNFYTTNTDPTAQTVTLLGSPITIEATPVTYVWHFGGTAGIGTRAADLTTTDPGAPYPDLRVTHRYLRTGAVRPSLDTVYAGRYRIGNGAWQQIPDTLTVAGAPQDLQVVSATPHLVGY